MDIVVSSGFSIPTGFRFWFGGGFIEYGVKLLGQFGGRASVFDFQVVVRREVLLLKTAVMVVVVVFMLRCRVGELCGVDGWRGGKEPFRAS